MGVASRHPASPVRESRTPVGPLGVAKAVLFGRAVESAASSLGGFFRRLIAVHEFAALAMARMSALTASGNVGQAAISTSKSAPTAPDSAAPVADKVVFPENFLVGSNHRYAHLLTNSAEVLS